MATAQIAAIDPTNLRDSAYRSLHDAFTRGAFAPGDVLSLRSLAEQLGTSMTPVREAVRRLVAQGALIDTRSRKLLVPAFDARRMKDLKLARLALESLILDQAMANIDATSIDSLKAILERPSNLPQEGPDLVQNYDFHFTLYRMSGSDVLLHIIEALWLQYGSYLNLIINQRDVQHIQAHKFHSAIINALEQNDRGAAQAALIGDIEQSFSVLQNDSDTALSPT